MTKLRLEKVMMQISQEATIAEEGRVLIPNSQLGHFAPHRKSKIRSSFSNPPDTILLYNGVEALLKFRLDRFAPVRFSSLYTGSVFLRWLKTAGPHQFSAESRRRTDP